MIDTAVTAAHDPSPAPALSDRAAAIPVAWFGELLAMLLAGAGAAMIMLWAFEWPYYQTWLGDQSTGGLHTLLVQWTIWSKTMLMLVPGTLIAAVLLRFGRRRVAWAAWIVWGAMIAAWIGLDGHVYDIYGRHITTLLRFATQPEAMRWAGGVTPWLAPTLIPAAAALVVLCVTAWAAQRVTRRMVRRQQRGVFMLTLVLIAMPLALQHYISVALFERTRMLFPLNVTIWGEPPHHLDVDDPAVHALDDLVRQPVSDILPQAVRPAPVDPSAVFTATPQSPNVILIVLESLNWDIDGYELMPKLQARARSGLRAHHHYSGGNHSEAGLFAILYGRPPLAYFATLDVPVVPQMLASFSGSGYETRYISSAHISWNLMERFVQAFDSREVTGRNGNVQGDIDAMQLLTQAVQERGDKPLFAMAFLMSTHTPFDAPPEYDAIKQDVPAAKRAAPHRADEQAREYARYLRAARFLDDQIDQFLESIDLSRNIVVICGDHGESLFDDGLFSHYTRLSDAQTRTPMIIVGAGIPPREIHLPTSHIDLLPTLLHAASSEVVPLPTAMGQDLLAESLEERYLLVATINRFNPLELALIDPRDQQRLNFSIDLSRTALKLHSFAGADGEAKVTGGHTPAQTQAWAQALQQQFDRLGRTAAAGGRP